MIKIENIEEKKEILNTLYWGDYIKNLETRDKKYFDKLMKNYYLFKTDDNYTIVIELDKPSIDSTLWFDDEKPIPKLSEELFINYNLHNLRTINKKEHLKTFIYNSFNNIDNKYNCVLCSQDGYSYSVNDNTFKRYLTDEEENIILQIDEENKQNYIKRLKTYFKKYSNNIHCMGYWVNR